MSVSLAARIAFVLGATNDTRVLELPKLERQHPVRDRWIVPAQIAEPFRAVLEPFRAVLEVIEEQRRPAPAQHLHHFFDRTARDEVFHGEDWLQKCA